MSAHGHHDETHGAGGAAHGTRHDYITGFLLAAVLTAVPFALVMSGVITDMRITAGIITVLAMVQIVVHMIYFLHMNARSESGWTLMALIFTIIIVVIALSGSLWVMVNMNQHMMAPMPQSLPAEHTMDMGRM